MLKKSRCRKGQKYYYYCISFFPLRSIDLSGDIMASSSSSNTNSSTTNKLTNSYFFYGTHPLKVPNMNCSNSSNDLSTYAQTTQHLSLVNGSTSSSDMPTTKSLQDMAKSFTEDEETSEVSILL